MLTARFTDAFAYALDLYAGKVRQSTRMPAMAHLLGVTSLVLQHGGTEDEAIGALLHDSAEDAGGRARLADIQVRFGPDIAAIVEDCSDNLDRPDMPWLARKREYVDHVAKASASAILVSVADKINNVGAIIADYRIEGETLWDRFDPDARKAARVGYYRGLVTAYRAAPTAAPHTRAIDALDRLVCELEDLAGMRGVWPPQSRV